MIRVEINYINNIDKAEIVICYGSLDLLDDILNYFGKLDYVKIITHYKTTKLDNFLEKGKE